MDVAAQANVVLGFGRLSELETNIDANVLSSSGDRPNDRSKH
jgi:hypothetical protein